MKGKLLLNKQFFVEMRMKYYMQSLSVETPEHVIQYLERRLAMYKSMLEKRSMYPEIMIVSIQRLVEEYSRDTIRIKKYTDNRKNHDSQRSHTFLQLEFPISN